MSSALGPEAPELSKRERARKAGIDLLRVHLELAQREAAEEQLRAWRGAQYYFGAMAAMAAAALLTEAAVLVFLTEQFGWRADAVALGLALLNGLATWILFAVGDRKLQERPFMSRTRQRVQHTLDTLKPPPPPETPAG